MPASRSSSSKHRASRSRAPASLPKALTGIDGVDQITHGGLPRSRPTLVCGGAGCGKTLFAVQFLANGAAMFDEPGVFVSFEESAEELLANFATLGTDLHGLIAKKKLVIDYVHVTPGEIDETGDYDLEGLFVRIAAAIDEIGAKRVVLDTPEALFGGFANEGILRAEIRRLFRWLKDRGVTAVITAERGREALTRFGLEEYVSDCVIVLEHRDGEQISTRNLRVVKYRGSTHGTDSYPFLIDDHGISVLPVTALGLDYPVSTERISTGVRDLDDMLGGKGYFRASSVLISGTAGTGKSSLAAYFADSVCRRGEKVIYFALEEPHQQIVRNMRSIGLDLEPWIRKGLLHIEASRPTLYGLELHLVRMHKLVEQMKPAAIIVDPISSLVTVGNAREVKSVLTRLFDYLKMRSVTGLFTYLATPATIEETDLGASSLIDTWIQVRDLELDGERNRGVYVLKSRGMSHSNQVREFRLSDRGLELVEVYVGAGGVLTGTARASQEAREKADALNRQQDIARKERALEARRRAVEAQITALRDQLTAEQEEIGAALREARGREGGLQLQRDVTRQWRTGVAAPTSPRSTKKASGGK